MWPVSRSCLLRHADAGAVLIYARLSRITLTQAGNWTGLHATGISTSNTNTAHPKVCACFACVRAEPIAYGTGSVIAEGNLNLSPAAFVTAIAVDRVPVVTCFARGHETIPTDAGWEYCTRRTPGLAGASMHFRHSIPKSSKWDG